MALLEKIIYGVSKKLDGISGIALVAMMLLIFINVLSRAVWQPLLGTYEFTSLLASITISMSLAYCAVNKGHVAITLFADRFPRRVRSVLNVIVSLIGTVLFAVLSWQCVRYAITVYHSGEESMTPEMPFYPFIVGVAFGLLMLALVLLVDLFKALKRIITE
jgi:TRAP-type C4-dicarboxylate transport system permease small subunit